MGEVAYGTGDLTGGKSQERAMPIYSSNNEEVTAESEHS